MIVCLELVGEENQFVACGVIELDILDTQKRVFIEQIEQAFTEQATEKNWKEDISIDNAIDILRETLIVITQNTLLDIGLCYQWRAENSLYARQLVDTNCFSRRAVLKNGIIGWLKSWRDDALTILQVVQLITVKSSDEILLQ